LQTYSIRRVFATFEAMGYTQIMRRGTAVSYIKVEPGVLAFAVVIDTYRDPITQEDLVDALEAAGINCDMFFETMNGMG
jgi:hypothetical protein